jgi:hypothetical protein
MRIALAIALVLLSASPAVAQLANFYGGNLPIVDSTLRNYYDKSILRESMKRHGYDVPQEPGAAKANAQKPPVKHKPASASDFTPRKDRPAIDAFFAQNPMAPEHERLMRAMVEQLNKGIETQLRKNSVASAMGLTIATATSIADRKDLGDDALRELIAGFNDQLAASADFQKSKPDEKQALYDHLLLTTAVLVTLETLGTRDPGMAANAVATSKAVLVELGVRAN